MILLPECEFNGIAGVGIDGWRVIGQVAVRTDNDCMLFRSSGIAAGCAIRSRCRAGCSRVALQSQLLECGEGIGAVGGSIEAEYHALLTMTGLTTVTPYRFGIIDLDLKCREATRDTICYRFAT